MGRRLRAPARLLFVVVLGAWVLAAPEARPGAGRQLRHGAPSPGRPALSTYGAAVVEEAGGPALESGDLPAPEAQEPVPGAAGAESEAAPAATPAVPRPLREYAVPIARAGALWPFAPQVHRWQRLVEEELRALQAWRRLDGAITIELVLAIIAAESFGDPLAVSTQGAVGLMQVLPSTFADMVGDGDPFDPSLNVRAGMLYLNLALTRHGGDVAWALAAYHAGIGSAYRAAAGEGFLWQETVEYVAQVLDLRDQAFLMRGVAPPPPRIDWPADWPARLRPAGAVAQGAGPPAMGAEGAVAEAGDAPAATDAPAEPAAAGGPLAPARETGPADPALSPTPSPTPSPGPTPSPTVAPTAPGPAPAGTGGPAPPASPSATGVIPSPTPSPPGPGSGAPHPGTATATASQTSSATGAAGQAGGATVASAGTAGATGVPGSPAASPTGAQAASPASTASASATAPAGPGDGGGRGPASSPSATGAAGTATRPAPSPPLAPGAAGR